MWRRFKNGVYRTTEESIVSLDNQRINKLARNRAGDEDFERGSAVNNLADARVPVGEGRDAGANRGVTIHGSPR